MAKMKPKHFLMIVALSVMTTAAQSADPPAPQRVQRNEQNAMAQLFYVVDPQYPADAQINGKVVLRIVIDRQGHVSEASLVSGHPMLAGPTIDAVRQWKFFPYTLDKGPVEVETTATVEFSTDPPHVTTPKPGPVRLRISMGVADGLSLRKVKPSYPEEARTKHIYGDVILRVAIDKQGNVISTNVMSGDPLLAEAAVNAVKQWKYKPYLLNGEPVELDTSIKIQFRL